MIEIVGWDRFQHYKDRWPPWIKAYTDLLANDDYLRLSGHRRAVLHGLWLAYAMSHGKVTDNTAILSRRLSLKVTMRDLRALETAGFIALPSQKHPDPASSPLAKRSTNASPHALARGEAEAEDLRGSSSVSDLPSSSPYSPSYDAAANGHDDDGDLFTNTNTKPGLTRIGDLFT